MIINLRNKLNNHIFIEKKHDEYKQNLNYLLYFPFLLFYLFLQF